MSDNVSSSGGAAGTGGCDATSCFDSLIGSGSDRVGGATVSVLAATESLEDEIVVVVVDGATDIVRGQ